MGESDETILNVLRRAEDDYLSNQDIADELSIDAPQVNNRMGELWDEGEGRIERRNVGTGYLWKLSETETRTPIHPDYEYVADWSRKLRWWGMTVRPVGRWFTLAGAAVVVIALSAVIGSTPLPVYSTQEYLAGGYVSAAVGIVTWMLSYGLRLAAVMLPRFALWWAHRGES